MVVDLVFVIECLWWWSVFSSKLNLFCCGDEVSLDGVKVEVDCLLVELLPPVLFGRTVSSDWLRVVVTSGSGAGWQLGQRLADRANTAPSRHPDIQNSFLSFSGQKFDPITNFVLKICLNRKKKP